MVYPFILILLKVLFLGGRENGKICMFSMWLCTQKGDEAPEKCPVCGVPADKFNKVDEGEKTWAAEHVVGVAQGVSEDILADLRANFEGECSEVGM